MLNIFNFFDTKTNINSLVDNNPLMKEYKRKAKTLLKQLKEDNSDITLGYCHDLIAKQNGYKDWHEFQTRIKRLYLEVTGDSPSGYALNKPDNQHYYNYGYNPEIGLQLWLHQQTLKGNTCIFGNRDNRNILNQHLAKQSIDNGEHLVFLDSTGDESQLKLLEDHAISKGRLKDIRRFSSLNPLKENTVNFTTPLSYLPSELPGSSGSLTELFFSMLDQNSMWNGKAISLLSAVLMALVYMRDQKEIVLSFETIRKFIILENIEMLAQRKDFPIHIKQSLNQYLKSLPGYVKQNENFTVKQSDDVSEQHGYLDMVLSMILGRLQDTDDHMFKRETEFKYSDITGDKQNLILLVGMGDLRKYSEEAQNISLFITGIIKHQMAAYHPDMVVGNNSDVLKNNYKTYFLNECAFPKGISVLASNAKRQNQQFIFSYEDTKHLDHFWGGYDLHSNISFQIQINGSLENWLNYSLTSNKIIHDLSLKK